MLNEALFRRRHDTNVTKHWRARRWRQRPTNYPRFPRQRRGYVAARDKQIGNSFPTPNPDPSPPTVKQKLRDRTFRTPRNSGQMSNTRTRGPAKAPAKGILIHAVGSRNGTNRVIPNGDGQMAEKTTNVPSPKTPTDTGAEATYAVLAGPPPHAP